MVEKVDEENGFEGLFLRYTAENSPGYLTDEQFAADIGTEKEMVCRWFSGASEPQRKSLLKISKHIFRHFSQEDYETKEADFFSSVNFFRLHKKGKRRIDECQPDLARKNLVSLGVLPAVGAEPDAPPEAEHTSTKPLEEHPTNMGLNADLIGVPTDAISRHSLDTVKPGESANISPAPSGEIVVSDHTELSAAPLAKPLYVSAEQAFAEKNYNSAIWLNPHNHYSLPLVGRERELKLLGEFIGSEESFKIAALVAPSGAGKTRLVSEWAKTYIVGEKSTDWDAGFVESPDAALWTSGKWEPARDTLIIIDYTYRYGAVIGAIITRFKEWLSKKDIRHRKIRLLVLDHVLPERLYEDAVWKDGVPSHKFREGHDSLFFSNWPIELEPETDESVFLRKIISAAADPYTRDKTKRRYSVESPVVKEAYKALFKIGAANEAVVTPDSIRSRNAVRRPLFAALMGQMIRQDPNSDFSGINRRDLIRQYFSDTRRFPWLEEAEKDGMGGWAGIYVSAATLLRGVRRNDILEFQDNPPDCAPPLLTGARFGALLDVCARFVSSSHSSLLRPFEPDILGETFVLKFLYDRSDTATLRTLAAALSTFAKLDKTNDPVGTFLDSVQRLVRNLINDDQTLADVQESWEALRRFLNPKWYPKNSSLRRAVSIALGDIARQRRGADLDFGTAAFALSVAPKDLVAECSGSRWNEAAIAAIHCLDYQIETGGSTEQSIKHLTRVLSNFETRSSKRFSALMLAVAEDCLSSAKHILISFEEDIDASEYRGWTSLMIAAQQGHLRLVSWLLDQGAQPNAISHQSNWTALMLACEECHVEIVALLIAAGANVNQGVTFSGWTPLMAMSQTGTSEIVAQLIVAGATVNQAKTDDGRTALMLASKEGHAEIVTQLINAGATVDQATTDDGRTALMLASKEGHVEIVTQLISAGATVDQGTTVDGRTSLMIASREGHAQVVRQLIDGGATVNQKSTDCGWTALLAASHEGHSAIVSLLISSNAAIDLGGTVNGKNELISGCISGDFSVVRLLVEAGANLDAKMSVAGISGFTALMIASNGGYLEIVEYLLSKGANSKLATSDGRTASSFARIAGHLDVTAALREA